MNEIRVTKIQAAQRQIDVAIRMLFRNEDPVAIHTVAMAGFRILRDLTEKMGLEHPIDSMIKPGKEKEFWGALNSFSNFCKHADRDPNVVWSGFREDANDITLLTAATYYRHFGYEWTNEMQVLWSWYVSLHPDVLSEDAGVAIHALVLSTQLKDFRSFARKEQLSIGLTMLKKVGTSF